MTNSARTKYLLAVGVFLLTGCEIAMTPTDSPSPGAQSSPDATAPPVATDGGAIADALASADAPTATPDSGADVMPNPGNPAGQDGGVVVRPPISGNSPLAKLAAGMAAGTWAQLSAADQNATLGVGNVSGSMIHYCNSMPWNPFTQSIEILGMDHNWGHERHVRYSDATNQYELVSADIGLGTQTAHGYDHVSANPYNGDVYLREYGGFTGTIHVARRTVANATWSLIPDLENVAEQVAIGTTWWSGPFAGAGAQGGLVIFNSGNSLNNANDGNIAFFDPLANQWILNKAAMAPFYGSNYTYHSVIEYSPQKNVAVYGGGNEAPHKLWRLNADASFTVMPDTPASVQVGIQHGLLVNEPVTGNFLLLSAGELWELDPSGSGSWTKQTGSRTPPANVGIPGPSPTIDGMIAAAIPEYGVIVFVKQSSSNGGTTFIYRHA